MFRIAAILLGASLLASGCIESNGPELGPGDALADAVDIETLEWLVLGADPVGDAELPATSTVSYNSPCLDSEVHKELRENRTLHEVIPEEHNDTIQGGAEVCEAFRSPPNGTPAVPAPPSHDIVDVSVAQTTSSIFVRIGVHDMQFGKADYYGGPARYGSDIAVEWLAENGCAGVAVWYAYAEADHWDPASWAVADCSAIEGNACNPICWTGIPVTFTPGSPGSITMELPRHQFPLESGAMTITSATTYQQIKPTDGARWVDVQTSMAQAKTRVHGDTFGEVDAIEDLTLDIAPVNEPARPTPPQRVVDEDLGESTPRTRPDLNLLDLELVETPTHLVFSSAVESMPPNPPAGSIGFGFQLPGTDAFFDFGYTVEDGVRVPASSMWGNATTVVPPPFRFDVEEGTPGRLVATIAREDLPPIKTGAPVGLAVAYADQLSKDSIRFGFNASLERGSQGGGDVVGPLLHATYAMASTPPVVDGVLLNDNGGDLDYESAMGLEFMPFDEGPFDLLSAQFSPSKTDELTIELIVAGNPHAVIPSGYAGAFRGASFSTDRGSFMVGHYQPEGPESGTFFCAPDTVGFDPSPRDPGLSPERWNAIPGRLTGGEGSALASDSGVGAGRLVMHAPVGCLGMGDGDLHFEADTVRGVSFLFSNPTGQAANSESHLLDDAETSEGMALSFPAPVIEAKGFFVEPFGVQNFWDIFGVAIAVLLAATSVMVLVRKRVRMKRYLVELEDLADRHHDTPEQYAVELVSLRKRLYTDLLRNRLSEGHFVMVEERLRSSLSGTRINAFGAAFYDLPPALMIRLQSLLADGRFSPHDHRVLGELVGSLKIGATAKASVRGQLDLWANQDAEVARLTKQRRDERRRRFGLKRTTPQ